MKITIDNSEFDVVDCNFRLTSTDIDKLDEKTNSLITAVQNVGGYVLYRGPIQMITDPYTNGRVYSDAIGVMNVDGRKDELV